MFLTYLIFILFSFVLYKLYFYWKQLDILFTINDTNKSVSIQKLDYIYKVSCMMLFQYLNKSVKRIDKNKYEVSFYIDDNMYKIILNKKMGPKAGINSVVTSDGKDITKEIKPYYGPGCDWCSNVYEHKYCGYNNFVIKYNNNNQELININYNK